MAEGDNGGPTRFFEELCLPIRSPAVGVFAEAGPYRFKVTMQRECTIDLGTAVTKDEDARLPVRAGELIREFRRPRHDQPRQPLKAPT